MAMRDRSLIAQAEQERRTVAGEESADLELAADALLTETGGKPDGVRLYTERRLRSKIAKELRRLPEARTDGLPSHICEYLLNKRAQSICDGAQLKGLRRIIFLLHLLGLNGGETSNLLGVSRQLVYASIHSARRQVRLRPNKYAGLHEVYWREVHRHIYRKPRS